MTVTILTGDCRDVLKTLPDASVHCCVTSPPYFGLRDYNVATQIGMEPQAGEYISTMVEVFREVRRALRDDGTLWLNLGDSYGSRKQLLGIPWRVALALQADGWYLRQDIIWSKPNVMPESVRDRCVKSHEYIFLLTKSERYFFDHLSIKEESTATKPRTREKLNGESAVDTKVRGHGTHCGTSADGKRNKRSVWDVNTKSFKGAHFAVFPQALIEPCVKAGCPAGGVVLDPFGGAGTTGLVAERLGRNATLIEINPEYSEMSRTRISAHETVPAA